MGIIEVKNLSFAYDESAKTIDEVSFSIEEGTYTTIIGHNGSGKSTIAKLIVGLLTPTSGKILIDDEEVTIYLMNAKAPCFIKDETESYIYLILPVNFNANV